MTSLNSLVGAGLFAVFVAAAPASLLAQIHGRVTDAEGHSIPEAFVVAYRDGSRLDSARTFDDGRFSLASAMIGDRLFLHRIGFQPAYVRIKEDGSLYTLVIKVEPLEAVVASARARGRPCPNRESQIARQAWQRAASRYAPNVSDRGWAAFFHERTSGASPSIVSPPANSWSTKKVVRLSIAPSQSLDSIIYNIGYARPLVGADALEGQFGTWAYPRLELWEAYHFATPSFANLNVLGMIESDSVSTTISFCGRNSGKGRVEGWLRFSEKAGFEMAQWHFQPLSNNETAGGRAIFQSVIGGNGEHYLVPRVGTFWRRALGRKGFVHYEYDVGAWIVSEDRDYPSIPAELINYLKEKL